ncbi:MAG: hypothetical protein DRJ05_05265 [Bacteroidetes bacterium]|nr:MAG: hypothetical protein DRJ05_05265 [Bacteroidota bacterium]
MKIRLFLLLIGLFGISPILFSQTENLESVKPTGDSLCGTVNRQELQTGDFGKSFIEEYANYKPNQGILNKLDKNLFSYTMTIVLGTWCHDSEQQVPRMFKILDKMDFNTSKIQIICVDKKKTGCDTDISNMDIQRVPTFILYKGEKEVGRIIETPKLSLEEDMLNILSN